jgi:hypothetical protein
MLHHRVIDRFGGAVSYVAVCLCTLACGCSSNDTTAASKHDSPAAPKHAAPAPTVRKVRVIDDTSDFKIVLTDDGQELLVDGRLLRDAVDRDERFPHALQASPQIGTVHHDTAAMTVERASLASLFLSETTNRKVIAPGCDKPVVDGEVCWRAMMCENPDCPGEGDGDYPFLFINPRPGSNTFCPACEKIRDPTAETSEETRQYRWWVRPYVLPDAAERQRQLDKEHQRRLK